MSRSASRLANRYFRSVSLRYLPVARDRDRDRDQYLNHRCRVTSPKPSVSLHRLKSLVTQRARRAKAMDVDVEKRTDGYYCDRCRAEERE